VGACYSATCAQGVDVAIPANNKGKHSIGMLFYILTRMVLQVRLGRCLRWPVLPCSAFVLDFTGVLWRAGLFMSMLQ
jgi:hypothetical protein